LKFTNLVLVLMNKIISISQLCLTGIIAYSSYNIYLIKKAKNKTKPRTNKSNNINSDLYKIVGFR
jgi:hypothetical protein